MKITIHNLAHHRNGIDGAPFDVFLFEDSDSQGRRKLGILFEESRHCAVLDIAQLTDGDIAFGSNSWRGDTFEPHLRAALANSRAAEAADPDRGAAMTSDLLIPQRVQRCDAALAPYSDESGFTSLIDLLADARHWCDANDQDYADLDHIAYQHYLAELNEEPTEERKLP